VGHTIFSPPKPPKYASTLPLPMKPGVLLTDAHARSAAATCACLGRHGYRVGAATSDPPAPGGWSRYVNARPRVCDPRADPELFARQIADAATGGGFATVLPGSDASVLAISNHRDAFGDRVQLGMPPREAVDRCVDKAALGEYSAQAGIGSPETVACANPDEASATAARLGYPVLLKPRQTVFDDQGQMKQRQSFIAHDEEALRGAVPGFGLPCLLQRFETGGLVSIAGVAAGERLLSIAFSRYIRTWPPDAGPVSFSHTEASPPALVQGVSTLMRSLGWQGIFELELIERDDGGFAAIDFNPRLYGSVALAVRAGAPIPTVWCDWLLKGETAERTARAGVYYRWEEAETRNMLQRLRVGKLGEALSVIRPRRPLARAYLRWSDPGPALGMLVRLFKSRWADMRSARAERVRAD
jgi:predicted ATP-grasp superfamily ATP-dependent carboligase